MNKEEKRAFAQGIIFAFAEVIRNCGSVESAFDAAGFSNDEIEKCAEFDVRVLRDEFSPELPKGVE